MLDGCFQIHPKIFASDDDRLRLKQQSFFANIKKGEYTIEHQNHT